MCELMHPLSEPTHNVLRAYCHLNPDRSFSYDDGLTSLLCHRCTAIYSGFLLAFLLLVWTRWNGEWKSGKVATIALAAAMILLSLIQVKLEDFFGIFILTEAPMRFMVGCLTGFGLYQFNLLIQKQSKSGWQALPTWGLAPLLILVVLHFYLASFSFWYSAILSAVGAVLIYFVMNFSVLRSFFEKASLLLLVPLTLIMMGLEWWMIYMINRPS